MSAKINCPECGTEELREATFCSKCGAALHPPPELPDLASASENSALEIPVESKTVHEHIPSSPDAFDQKPQNPVFIFSVVGGIALLLFLIVIGAIVFGYYFLASVDLGKLVPAQTEKRVSSTPVPPKPVTFPTVSSLTRQFSFIVRAEQKNWQASEIEVDELQSFEADITGKMAAAWSDSPFGPEGVKGFPERRVFKEFSTGAVLMRIRFPNGEVSKIQPAASYRYWQTEKDEKGVIEFFINDNAPENNKGLFVFTAKFNENAK